MTTHEIQREDWPGFLNEISRRRQGHPVTVTVSDPGAPLLSEIRGLPLVGMSFDPTGSESGSIEIMVGAEVNDHLTHIISHPRRVYHKRGADLLNSGVNADEIVEVIADEEPQVTSIHFQVS